MDADDAAFDAANGEEAPASLDTPAMDGVVVDGGVASTRRLTPGRGHGMKVDFGPDVGYIRWFPFTNRFEASCLRPGHAVSRCRLTKYASESAGVGEQFNSAMGRPLGLMAAWLLTPFEGPANEHHNHFTVICITRQERVDARMHLSSLTGGGTIQCHERPQRTGEPEEPLGDP